MNSIQEAILVGSREESGIWEVINDVADSLGISRGLAFSYIKAELNFIIERKDVFLIKSDRLFESDGCVVLESSSLADLLLDDVEFNDNGPFYYFSNVPEI